METIGRILKKTRLELHLTLADISKQTNIAPHLLDFLEQDDYTHLPSSTFTKGFIISYAQILGFDSSKALAIFRRDFCVDESGKIMPRGLAKPLDKETFVASNFLKISAVSMFVVIFSAYLFYQIKTFHKVPEIEVTKPKAHSIVQGPNIPIQGFVSADSVVYVNGNLAQVYPNGEFTAMASLPPGDQSVVIKAVDASNKTSDQTIPVKVVGN